MRRILLVSFLVGSGCNEDPGESGSSETGEPCPDGDLGCPCYGNQTCNDDLVCETGSNICEEGAATDSAMTTVATGSAETTAGPPSAQVTLYAASQQFAPGPTVGDARTTLDGMCAAEIQAGCSTSVALISVSPTDQVSDFATTHGMPFDVPVMGTTAQIADSFQSLLAGTPLTMSLDAAGVFAPLGGAPFTLWWTGSLADGTASAQTCVGWTAADATSFGASGNRMGVDATWFTSSGSPCNAPRPIVCACW